MRLGLVGFITAMVLGGIGPAHGATITVGPGAGYDFASIQAGVDAAVDADTVLVAPGEYVITEPITFRGKAITVKSEAGPDETTIRMGTPSDTNRGTVVIFENGETTASVLDGFTITGGRGSLTSRSDYPTDLQGGGILFDDASSGTVRNCTVAENTATNVAGVAVASADSVTLTNCIIRRNSATFAGGGVGSGYNAAMMTMTNCTIVENSAGLGPGGVLCNNSSMTMAHCVIAGNTAGEVAGGLYNEKSPMTLLNCTIWGNSAGNTGGGLVCTDGASATVTNSIFWENSAPEGDQIGAGRDAPSVVTVTYSNVAGGQAGVYLESGGTLDWGEGNIDADPCFVDPSNDDFHLKSQAGRWDPASQTWVQDDVTSPCIDAGDLMSPIGWELFPNGGFVNMGAYGGTLEASNTYFGEPPCETIIAGDINGDGQVNRADLEIMALHWTDDVPLPLP